MPPGVTALILIFRYAAVRLIFAADAALHIRMLTAITLPPLCHDIFAIPYCHATTSRRFFVMLLCRFARRCCRCATLPLRYATCRCLRLPCCQPITRLLRCRITLRVADTPLREALLLTSHAAITLPHCYAAFCRYLRLIACHTPCRAAVTMMVVAGHVFRCFS